LKTERDRKKKKRKEKRDMDGWYRLKNSARRTLRTDKKCITLRVILKGRNE